MHRQIMLLFTVLVGLAMVVPVFAAEANNPARTLIKNGYVIDGRNIEPIMKDGKISKNELAKRI